MQPRTRKFAVLTSQDLSYRSRTYPHEFASAEANRSKVLHSTTNSMLRNCYPRETTSPTEITGANESAVDIRLVGKGVRCRRKEGAVASVQ
jgi:hypothetical protein